MNRVRKINTMLVDIRLSLAFTLFKFHTLRYTFLTYLCQPSIAFSKEQRLDKIGKRDDLNGVPSFQRFIGSPTDSRDV